MQKGKKCDTRNGKAKQVSYLKSFRCPLSILVIINIFLYEHGLKSQRERNTCRESNDSETELVRY